METFYNLFFAARTLRLDVILLALIAGAAVFMLFYGMVSTNKGKATSNKTLVAVQHAASRSSQRELSGVQARLDKANLDMKAGEYVRRSLTLGIPLGIGLFVLVGAIVLSAVGVLAGFMFTWTRLEQERDKKQIRYSKQLASSCDTIRTSYGVNPSLKRALEAGAEFSQDDLKVDFQELVISLGQERFVEGLQAVADRRRSIVFDGVSTALIRASEATGEVNEMLHRLADSTRQNVAAFEEALSSQINARSSITWGTYGPWMIFAAFKIATLFFAAALGAANLFGSANAYFSSFQGNLVALGAAGITIFTNRYCNSLSQRGLVVQRLATTEAQSSGPVISRGQSQAQQPTLSPRGSMLSAQHNQAGAN